MKRKDTSKCQKCKKEYLNRSLMWYQGEHICKMCYRKITTMIPITTTMEDIERRIRIVTPSSKKNAIIRVPPYLANYKIMIKIVGSPDDSIDSIKKMRDKENGR